MLWKWLEPGDVILGDRAYDSYASMALLKVSHGVDMVARRHQRRKIDRRKAKRLGKKRLARDSAKAQAAPEKLERRTMD